MIVESILVAGIIGLLFAAYKGFFLVRQEEGNEKMNEIASFIRSGAMEYLKKQYSILAVFVIVVGALLYLFIGQLIGVCFVVGAFSSALAGFIGMNFATIANVRTTQAVIKKGLKHALKVSFSSGTIMALFASSIGLLGIAFIYLIFQNVSILFGFAFGASSVALFARVGGGIYTKAADVGADLVGKVEKHIPEDDLRNPAVIADNVGDNVGDVAGMGADLFESYVGAIISAMAIGFIAFGMTGLLFPMVLCGIGIIASIIGTFFVSGKNIHTALQKGLWIASIIAIVVAGAYSYVAFGNLLIAIALTVGIVAGLLIGWHTDRYTSEKGRYAKKIAKAAETGVAPTILEGFVVGMKSTRNTLIIIAAAILAAFVAGGIYGVAIAGVGMLSTLGISLAIDAFGPVVDNAGGIAEMSKQSDEVRKVTDELDAAGNTTAAIGKGFAIGSAALTALALFSSYVASANLQTINIAEPRILIGVLLGGMLPFWFSSMTTSAVGKSAMRMIEEVRRQFREIKGLLQGKAKADHRRCVRIAASDALKSMIAPGVLAILAPIIVGYVLGAAALGGLLVGTLVTGVCLANFLSNSGGAWDNAKKSVESVDKKTKKTKRWNEIHDALIIGDTVGDPFKDCSGPSLNILIKLMTVISILLLPIFAVPLF